MKTRKENVICHSDLVVKGKWQKFASPELNSILDEFLDIIYGGELDEDIIDMKVFRKDFHDGGMDVYHWADAQGLQPTSENVITAFRQAFADSRLVDCWIDAFVDEHSQVQNSLDSSELDLLLAARANFNGVLTYLKVRAWFVWNAETNSYRWDEYEFYALHQNGKRDLSRYNRLDG